MVCPITALLFSPGKGVAKLTHALLGTNSIYTPFSYTVTSKPPMTADLLGLDEDATNGPRRLDQQQLKESIPEVFYFDYGVVVIWGMTEQEESRLLQELSKFEEEKLGIVPDKPL